MPFLGGVQREISQWRSVESVSLRRKIFCVIQTDHVSCVWIITLFKALYSSSIANINDIRWAETWNCSICSILFLVGLPFFILTPKHSPFKRGFFCNDESIRYPLKEDTISYQLLGGVMIPFTLIVVSQEYSSTTKASYLAFGQHVWLFFSPHFGSFSSDRMWRVPFCLPVTRQEPVFGDQVYFMSLQSCGELRVWSCCQSVSDGHSQILHWSFEAKLPGCMQPSVGSYQLQSWWIHRELHLQRGWISGGWSQVKILSTNQMKPIWFNVVWLLQCICPIIFCTV